MTHRDFLFKRWIDKEATTEELKELARIIADEGYSEEDEIFRQLMDVLEQKKIISETDRLEAVDKFYSRWNQREKSGEKDAIPINRSRRYVWWSAAAAIVFALGLAWYTGGFKRATTTESIAINETPSDTVITIKGTKFVVLPDSSTVLLNEGSELTYTKRYGVDTREVTLMGEAFFDVAYNPLTPFKVRTGKLVTDVLGTAFNIKVTKDPSGGDNFTVTVTRGKVAVSDESRSYGTLTPNEQIVVNSAKNVGIRSKVRAEIATSWTNQFIVINNLPLEEAIALIAARFKVKITLESKDKDVRTCKITSAFLEKPQLETVLRVVTAVVNATYTIKDGKVIISGGECRR